VSGPQHGLWGRPIHHEDVEHKSHHVAWIELFYDLVHVVCIFMLGNYLSHHLSAGGFFAFLAIAAMIWIAWGDTVFYTSLYVTNDAAHRLIMALQMCAVMVFAAAIPNMPGKGDMFFALGYGANRALLALMYWRAIRHNETTSGLATQFCRMFAVAAAAFLISAFLPKPFNYTLWAITILGIQWGYLSPSRGVMRFERFTPRREHLAERFALLTLIVIGEGFFKMVVTLSEKGIDKVDPAIFVNYVIGGLALFALCWIYFDFSGARAVKSAKRDMYFWWYSHLVMMIAAVMIGVALTGEVKVGLFEPYPVKYGVIGSIGLAVFLATCRIIQQCVEDQRPEGEITFALRMSGIGLALLTLVIVPFVPAIVGNAVWGTALFSQVVLPLWRARRRILNSDPVERIE
jgi:low temperature requirement protein LtrA